MDFNLHKDGSKVYSWLYKPGVIDRRWELEVEQQMVQYQAYRTGRTVRESSRRGDANTSMQGGYDPLPVYFIGPAGECRFDAAAEWDKHGGAQAKPKSRIFDLLESLAYEGIRAYTNNKNIIDWLGRFVPEIRIEEDKDPRFSPLIGMAFGKDEECEMVEFPKVADDDEDENNAFDVEEYELEEG
ncbi:uncharacterized protein LOC128554517 [Mercenaria mercenaria]|uniref:uncharacterized protein LOC128554517 n=1 Tax=Mercenaria mercenaria TaxID=6596 RepID=UPI00234F832A|nr:uncharacterized protein LOC128554517 [Mercenaria mercenaria]